MNPSFFKMGGYVILGRYKHSSLNTCICFCSLPAFHQSNKEFKQVQTMRLKKTSLYNTCKKYVQSFGKMGEWKLTQPSWKSMSSSPYRGVRKQKKVQKTNLYSLLEITNVNTTYRLNFISNICKFLNQENRLNVVFLSDFFPLECLISIISWDYIVHKYII